MSIIALPAVTQSRLFTSMSPVGLTFPEFFFFNGYIVILTFCLHFSDKPYGTNLTSTHSKACLNDSVTLTCTTDANPPAHEYRFYLNDQLAHTSSSGVYQFAVPQSGNNTYKCEPKNSVGYGVNATVIIPTKSKLLSFNTTPLKANARTFGLL